MPQADGKHLCASILTNVAEMRSWVNLVVNNSRIGDGANAPQASFRELCGLSEQLLSAATELTGLAIQVTQAAQLIHTDEKNA
jgi:hypothetical protein